MHRARTLALIAVSLASSALAAVPTAPLDQQESPPDSPDNASLRIYDLRDLRERLDQASRGQSSVDTLVSSLSAAMNIGAGRVGDSIYAVRASEQDHVRFGEILTSMRGIDGDACDVELGWYSAPAGAAPAIGAEAAPGPDAQGTRQGVRTGAPSRINITRDTTYISDWTPVVADNSVGYDPQTGNLVTGLETEVRISPSGEGVNIQVIGQISRAKITRLEVDLPGAESRKLPIDLPVTDGRTISADVSTTWDRATVIAVIPDFEDGKVIALTVAVRRQQAGTQTPPDRKPQDAKPRP